MICHDSGVISERQERQEVCHDDAAYAFSVVGAVIEPLMRSRTFDLTAERIWP